MITLIYLIVVYDRWIVLRVQSYARAVTAHHLVMGELARKICRKQKKPRRSRRNRTRSCKRACRLANIIQHSNVFGICVLILLYAVAAQFCLLPFRGSARAGYKFVRLLAHVCAIARLRAYAFALCCGYVFVFWDGFDVSPR